jgi:hypothetical protein
MINLLFCVLTFWVLSQEAVAAQNSGRAKAAPADQKDHPGERDKAEIDAHRKRWQSLSADEKRELQKRFALFKKLPSETQEAFRRRHEELLRIRERIAAESQAELANLPASERRRILDQRVREELRELERRIKKMDIPGEPPPGHPDRRHPRKMRQALRDKNEKLANRALREMTKDGTITKEELSRLQSLPREERDAHILRLQKHQMLDAFEKWLPPKDVERFRKLPARRFHEEVHRQRREHGLLGPFSGLCELTPEQKDTLDALSDSEERRQQMRAFLEENLRRRLLDLGIEPAEIDALFTMPLRQRHERIRGLILEMPPDQIPPYLRESLERSPPPPPPGRGGKRGNGRRPRPPDSADGESRFRFFHAVPRLD